MSNARPDRGTVVLVDVPYLDATQIVRRPALVISDASQVLDVIHRGDLQPHPQSLPPTHYIIDRQHTDWSNSGLRLESVVRCDRLFTVDGAAIVRHLGRLSPATLQEIDARLKIAMGMS